VTRLEKRKKVSVSVDLLRKPRPEPTAGKATSRRKVPSAVKKRMRRCASFRYRATKRFPARFAH
jgi:hypothetical protein